MNVERPLNWHESAQYQTNLRQPLLTNYGSKQGKTGDFPPLHPNNADLGGQLILYESLPCICFALDSRKIIRSVSQFAAAYLGYDVLELTQNSVCNLFYGEDRANCQAQLTKVQQQPHQITQWEARLIGKNGTILWVKAKASLVPGTESQPIITLVCEDITDRIQASEALRLREVQFSSGLQESRKQASEALRQQFIWEQLVGAIAQRIHQSLNLEEILNTTVAEVRQALESDRTIIFRLNANGSGVIVVESVNPEWMPISGTSIDDRHFAEGYIQLYKQGRVQAIDDIETANLTQCHRDLLARFQVRANLVVPIVHEEKLWGLLVAQQCSKPRLWQHSEIDLLSSLATQAAIAIQQAELYQQAQTEMQERQQAEESLQQQFQRERLISAIAQRIRQSLNLEEILKATAAEVRQVLETDRVVIFRFEPDWSGNVVVESVASSCFSILGRNIYDPCFKEAYVVPYQQGRVKAIDDIYTANLDPCHINLLEQCQVRANLVVPILQNDQTSQNSQSPSQNRLWGLLVAHHCTSPRQWGQWETDLLTSLASQVAIAIQQAELYEQSRLATTQARTQAQQLKLALSELQQTQSQLVQSEKMSSLGQLVAGVAHEINNPVSFIYGNLMHADGYAQDILGLLKLYQQHYPNPAPEITSEIESIDLDFLREDLPKLLSSMKVGAERICEIVAALRNFSRFAEAEIKPIDLHEGLDSTLMILQNRLKAAGGHPEIHVIKEYGNLPLVECYAGQLNQVFMNLLSNALDAIDEQNLARTSVDAALRSEELQANPSFIRVRTELVNNCEVTIRIADNGPGMTEEVKAKLFDPFFTTKAVGTGTGLGLSISYQIVVEKHGGEIECYSQLGQGTEFVIQIPIQQPVKRS